MLKGQQDSATGQEGRLTLQQTHLVGHEDADVVLGADLETPGSARLSVSSRPRHPSAVDPYHTTHLAEPREHLIKLLLALRELTSAAVVLTEEVNDRVDL
jgi:hypothetical protein